MNAEAKNSIKTFSVLIARLRYKKGFRPYLRREKEWGAWRLLFLAKAKRRSFTREMF